MDADKWNDISTPLRYNTDPQDEVVAVRTRAGLYDVTALNILKVNGVDAASVLDKLVAIDVTSIVPGSSKLAAEVDEFGAINDDIMVWDKVLEAGQPFGAIAVSWDSLAMVYINPEFSHVGTT